MSDVIKITNLSKSFGSLKAVDDLNLCVPRGTIFGFLGPNGAGKSTTIRLLLGLIKPDTGKINLLGQSVTTGRNSALRKVGAFVEEPDFYINLSARQNLRLLARLTGPVDDSRIREVLDIVDLTDRADDKVKAYSRGMRQRLGIAQALLDQPQLLILDEPTASLDPAGIRDIRQLIIRRAAEEKMTVFLSSHILHEVEQMCTDLAVVHRGRLIEAGPVRELLQKSGLAVTEFQVDELDKALSLLANDAAVREAKLDQESIKIMVERQEVPRLTRKLIAADIAIRAVIPRTSLEDYFLHITQEIES